MSKKKIKKDGECIYCGNFGEITKDHIPPKNLFETPRPDTLITVPCCFKCNNDASKDDEYFKLNLMLRGNTPNHLGANNIYQSTLRGLARNEASGFREEFFSRMKPNGNYDVNLSRIDNVAKRTIAGIFYFEQNRTLPKEYCVETFSISGFTGSEHEEIIAKLLSTEKKSRDNNDIFVYWNQYNEFDTNVSIWLLLFFQTTAFIGMTVPLSN